MLHAKFQDHRTSGYCQITMLQHCHHVQRCSYYRVVAHTHHPICEQETEYFIIFFLLTTHIRAPRGGDAVEIHTNSTSEQNKSTSTHPHI